VAEAASSDWRSSHCFSNFARSARVSGFALGGPVVDRSIQTELTLRTPAVRRWTGEVEALRRSFLKAGTMTRAGLWRGAVRRSAHLPRRVKAWKTDLFENSFFHGGKFDALVFGNRFRRSVNRVRFRGAVSRIQVYGHTMAMLAAPQPFFSCRTKGTVRGHPAPARRMRGRERGPASTYGDENDYGGGGEGDDDVGEVKIRRARRLGLPCRVFLSRMGPSPWPRLRLRGCLWGGKGSYPLTRVRRFWSACSVRGRGGGAGERPERTRD
jgi:hypothetical protein